MSMVHRSESPGAVRSGDAIFDDLPECKVKRNYTCPTCDFFTQNPRHYLYHLRDVHEERVRIYECPNCLYASKHFQKLVRHTKMVHGVVQGERPPADDTHVSSEEEDFRCSVCSFSTKSRTALERHERQEHIKTKFFRCTKCTYATHMKARFTKHVKYHSMPMIKCDMCDFRTPYKWNLDRHCKNHNGKGAFRCSACNFTADIKQSLTVHEMNHHVPPVGQAAGLGVGRRRNKVGASDAAAAEEAARQEQALPAASSLPPTSDADPSAKKAEVGSFGPDFINPEDIIQHASGNVYIKNKCKLCNFKTAWPSEMTRHEQKVHNVGVDSCPKPKKATRPIPNLIPIPKKKKEEEPEMSQQDMEDICAKSANSSLKDFAKLFNSEEVFDNHEDDNQLSDLFAKNKTEEFKQKNASFFDKLKERLITGANLSCQACGHKSKCLSEQLKHQQKCGGASETRNRQTPTFTSSSRCQYCRQRCKSSHGLLTHLQTCSEALKATEESDSELKIDETQSEDSENNNKPHPMENRVFVWNNIEVPMDIDVDDSKYEYTDKMDDSISLDLSIRTQSPSERSENSFGQDYASVNHISPVADKIPTHGNDISVAQHKRVFKCPHCTFWASTASRFHVHIVGHLNKKPFECSLCAYRSNWRWDITKHIKLKSVRDPAHENAKVLMTDETGRRNYTKYNKYLTEIHVSGNQSLDTSGGSGTRPKNHDRSSPKSEVVKRTPEFSGLRPPPPLKAAEGFKGKRSNAENKRTLFKCKKCNFRDASRDILLEHVKGHYPQGSASSPSTSSPNQELLRGSSPDKDEASVSTLAKANFRCGHCNQVSNWKHVIQRHCRLKHSGDIRVVSNKNGQEKVEIEEQTDEPDHVDVVQEGAFKCSSCPYSTDDQSDFNAHLPAHSPTADSIFKCNFCNYFVNQKEDLYEHLKLHGIVEPEDFLNKLYGEEGKRYRCAVCPYVTNSKSQYTYHKQFHKPRGGQYNCTHCSYNVSKRHLLHQHLKVHGINVGQNSKQNGDADIDEMSDIEEVTDGQSFLDIPLVWVSKNEKFSKMFKCRYCPHVNSRKVNIQEHEKMHSVREKNPRGNDVEHRCTECNYVCNNAGVLSSHSKVHQGLYGTVHCLVDPVKTDDEQIRELTKFLNPVLETINLDDYENAESSYAEEMETESCLFFCADCPARFLKENEYKIHMKLHGLRSYYKCEFCSYSARQKPHLLAHENVHSQQYQERTQVLQTMYKTSNHQPELFSNTNAEGKIVWSVSEKTELEMKEFASKPTKSLNIPLSGTELFAQKNEAEQKAQLLKESAIGHQQPQETDPNFGIQGNPNFVYPTYLKNGKMKEKRYKCHKCPSAFEKREQYKTHVNLHGSNQRYNCEHCDYSVKYYANYVQHLKKHKLSSEAMAAREDAEVEEVTEDKKQFNILQQRLVSTSPKEQRFQCEHCPFESARRDALDGHQRRHLCVSGVTNSFACEHCDFSVPQVQALKEHSRLHFVAPGNKVVAGYMVCDNLKLVSKEGQVVYEERGGGEGVVPPLSEDVSRKFNNNDGEKQFVNLGTGEVEGMES